MQHHAGQGASDAVHDLNADDDQSAELIETGRLALAMTSQGQRVLGHLHTIKICDRLGDMATSLSISTSAPSMRPDPTSSHRPPVPDHPAREID